jgi:hypothetical protein
LKSLERQVSLSRRSRTYPITNIASLFTASFPEVCPVRSTRIDICQTLHRALAKTAKGRYRSGCPRRDLKHARRYIISRGRISSSYRIAECLFTLLVLAEPDTLPLFHNLRSSSDSKSDDPYGPLIKCLSMQDEFVLLESLRIMALLIS